MASLAASARKVRVVLPRCTTRCLSMVTCRVSWMSSLCQVAALEAGDGCSDGGREENRARAGEAEAESGVEAEVRSAGRAAGGGEGTEDEEVTDEDSCLGDEEDGDTGSTRDGDARVLIGTLAVAVGELDVDEPALFRPVCACCSSFLARCARISSAVSAGFAEGAGAASAGGSAGGVLLPRLNHMANSSDVRDYSSDRKLS